MVLVVIVGVEVARKAVVEVVTLLVADVVLWVTMVVVVIVVVAVVVVVVVVLVGLGSKVVLFVFVVSSTST